MDYIQTGVELIKRLKEFGYEAYFVGGFVRDYLIPIPIHDIDITTNATPHDLMKIFKKTIPKGIKYNSIVVVLNEYSFEVTTYRSDLEYVDNRHPIIETVSSIEEDLKRRDFTINAIAMDENFKFIDLFQGINDIELKCIRAIGKPDERFQEDALRMLRACYFVGKLDFIIDEDTFSSIQRNASLIKKISPERVYGELNKIIRSKHSLKALQALLDTGMCKCIPGLEEGVNAYLKHEIVFHDMRLFLATCFYESPEGIHYYRISKKRKKEIKDIITVMHHFKSGDYSNYTLSLYDEEICLQANILASALKIATNQKKRIMMFFQSNNNINDKDIVVTVPALYSVIKDWEKSHEIYLIIKKRIINNELANNKQDVWEYITRFYL